MPLPRTACSRAAAPSSSVAYNTLEIVIVVVIVILIVAVIVIVIVIVAVAVVYSTLVYDTFIGFFRGPLLGPPSL